MSDSNHTNINSQKAINTTQSTDVMPIAHKVQSSLFLRLVQRISRVPSKQAEPRRFRSSGGAFLLDAMIAMFVAISGLLACVSLFTSSFMAANGAQQNALAYNAARQVMENIRSSQGAAVATGTNMDAAANFGPVPELAQMDHGSGSVTISNWSSDNTVKCVAVTITWYDGHKTANFTSSTLIGPNGVVQ